jgi:hypothetical protein
MTKLLNFAPSSAAGKKYMVSLETSAGRSKTIHFGDSSLKDFTTHNPLEREERKRLYLARHRKTENWNDPETAGFWSRWVLWGDTPSIKTNLARTKSRFGL